MADGKHHYNMTLLLLPPGHGMVSYGRAQVHTRTDTAMLTTMLATVNIVLKLTQAALRRLSYGRVERLPGCVNGCMLQVDCPNVPDANFAATVVCPDCDEPLYTATGKARFLNYYFPLKHHVADMYKDPGLAAMFTVRHYQGGSGTLLDSRGYKDKVLDNPKVRAEPRATVWQLNVDGVPINK